MSKIINLNQARKSRARAAKRARGDENARRHGMSKAEREATAKTQEKSNRHLDGHALQKPNSGSIDSKETP
ncbi:DUF4169 family protein [Primorskyibacter sp. S187A]|uniref:DUF4169 family protein n=1 Tax=Primorskyibacter sp. S187A TaxID=3415130 RepID=UPI003C7C5222